jgi:hypothetical protein
VRGAGAGRGGDADDRHGGDRNGDPTVALDRALAALTLQSFIERAVAGHELIVRPTRLIQFRLSVLEIEGGHTFLPGSFSSGRYNPSRFTWVPKTAIKEQSLKCIVALLSISRHIPINIGAAGSDRRPN